MAIEVLVPHISCICLPNEIDAALAEGYNEVYILTTSGIIKHQKFRGTDRYIRIKVDSIPGRATPVTVKEELKFLPAGKVPFELYRQIEAFFREVSKRRGNQLEAIVFIMWNQEKGYHLFVPNQRVSAAAVSFDPSEIPSDAIIVIDVHSHNSMGAFFSGTDNNDDSTKIRFSGVFGRLNTPKAETVWRFNYLLKKFEVTASDLFEDAPVEVSQEWLDKISLPVYPTSVYGGNSNLGNVGGRGKADHLRPYQFKPGFGNSTGNPGTGNQVGQNASHPRNPSTVNDFESDQFNKTFFGHGYHSEDAYAEFYEDQAALAAYRRSLGIAEIDLDGNGTTGANATQLPANPRNVASSPNGKWGYDPSNPIVGTIPTTSSGVANVGAEDIGRITKALSEQREHHELAAAERGVVNLTEDPNALEEVGAYQAGKLEATSHDGNEEPSNLPDQDFCTDLYNDIIAEHGLEVADAWWDIDNSMPVLHDNDPLLQGLMFDMFELQSEDGKTKFFRDLFERIPSKDRNAIESYGF